MVRLLLRHRRLFQSTLPARGATKLVAVFARDREDFNPRSPHGERRLARATRKRDNIISIHAPRTGSDEALFAIARAITRISIHAPRTGSDSTLQSYKIHLLISIHAPRTGSDGSPASGSIPAASFQSTLPARGATVKDLQEQVKRLISIHAPRTGSDRARGTQVAEMTISIHAPRTGSDIKSRS